MEHVAALRPEDQPRAIQLLATSFDADPGLDYVFPNSVQQARWLETICGASVRLVASYGRLNGIRDEHRTPQALAMWFLPYRPYPPPWYIGAWTSLALAPLILQWATFVRHEKLNRFYQRLLPSDRPLLYVAGLVVDGQHRRRGFGTQLLDWAKQYAIIHDCDLCLLSWTATLDFYRQRGLKVCAEGRLDGVHDTCFGLLWERPGTSTQQTTQRDARLDAIAPPPRPPRPRASAPGPAVSSIEHS